MKTGYLIIFFCLVYISDGRPSEKRKFPTKIVQNNYNADELEVENIEMALDIDSDTEDNNRSKRHHIKGPDGRGIPHNNLKSELEDQSKPCAHSNPSEESLGHTIVPPFVDPSWVFGKPLFPFRPHLENSDSPSQEGIFGQWGHRFCDPQPCIFTFPPGDVVGELFKPTPPSKEGIFGGDHTLVPPHIDPIGGPGFPGGLVNPNKEAIIDPTFTLTIVDPSDESLNLKKNKKKGGFITEKQPRPRPERTEVAYWREAS